MKKIFLSLLLMCFLIIITACANRPEMITETGFYMDTYISITVYNKEDAKLLDKAFEKCGELENILSKTIEESDIKQIENNRKSYVQVSEHTTNVIGIYKGLHEVSDGMLDCTIGSLTNLWDFKNNEKIIPDSNAIENAVTTVNQDFLIIEGNTVMLDSDDAQLDFGAVAKGYIADCVKEFLMENNVQSAILNFGGNVVTIGNKPDGTPYNVGIQAPFKDNENVIASVSVSDKAVITAGIYERYIESDNKIYHHILNPFTGYSVDTDLLSATIICDDAAIGDAYSTICILIGKDKALELINNTNDLEAIFIDENNEIHLTDEASKYLNKE